MPLLGSWWQAQAKGIASDRALRWYGVALALVNVGAAIQWLEPPRLRDILGPGVTPICWPFFDQCWGLRALPIGQLDLLVLLFLSASAWNAYLFARRATAPLGYAVLVGLSALKYAIILQDFRLTLNHHYMALWVVLAFLFLPRKRDAVKLLIVLMYLVAGSLKLHPDSQWLVGGAFYGRRPLGLPAALIPAECLYVIVLEVVLVFGLLSRRSWVFWAALSQFYLFHVASFWVVGFYYPLLMFLLLTIYPLDRLLPASPGSTVRPLPTARIVPAIFRTPPLLLLFTTFVGLQILPYVFSADAPLTGEGRVLAMSMFDAPIECRATLTVHNVGEARVFPLRAPYLTTRDRCDPIIYLYLANAYCDRTSGAMQGTEADLLLQSRRRDDTIMHSVVDLPTFCATRPRYALWHHNWWINADPQAP